jgi:cellulose synthase/poly-beta-1,6-N-acetylglucosamine synthase-like glycosyltransferase
MSFGRGQALSSIYCMKGNLLKPNRIYTHTMVKYSIVVPFNNEEENVTALYARLKQVMEQVGEPFELVLVDDGSRDRTYKLLEEIAAVDSRVLVVKLRRNFGQTSALAAGFDHARGAFMCWRWMATCSTIPTIFPLSLKSWKRATMWSQAGAGSGSTTS